MFAGIRIAPAEARPTATAADFSAAMRDYIEGCGEYHVSYFRVQSIDGDTANVVLRVPELMPSARKYRVFLRYGWSLRRPEPNDEPKAGP